MSTVVLGVTGCIGAYKAADIIRGLRRGGCRVVPVLTKHAAAFITPLTLQNLAGRPAVTDMFETAGNWDVKHIPLSEEASVLLVAPATANIIGKFACGIADDFLTTLFLAMERPVLIAPAMNTKMYNHPAVQENIRNLASRGCRFIGPVEGELATGHRGMGHLARVEDIVSATLSVLEQSDAWEGKRVLITAGPTQEDIDAIRYLTNRSSGKMGYALAAEAKRRGAHVVLISGPVRLDPPFGVDTIRVRAAAEMHREVLQRFKDVDMVVMCAAVADFRPSRRCEGKLRKESWNGKLELERTVDILDALGAMKEKQLLVGFAAEDGDLRAAAERKRKSKKLDLIVANDIASPDSGMGSDFSRALILDSDGREEEYTRIRKEALAGKIFDAVEKKWKI